MTEEEMKMWKDDIALISRLIEENKRLETELSLYKGNLTREHYKAHRSEIVAEKQARIDLLEQRIEKAIGYVRGLREKYFRMCVVGSNNDLSDLLEILKG